MVARHICAKYAIDEEADEADRREKLEQLRDFLRRPITQPAGRGVTLLGRCGRGVVSPQEES